MNTLLVDTILTFPVGAYVGSYIITVVSRAKNRERIRGGYSHCLACRHRLTIWDIFPILSYLQYKGRCIYCRARIGISVLVWEISIGLLYSVVTYYLYEYVGDFTLAIAVSTALLFHLVMRVDSKKGGL